jgi:YesN/AraC family two-component response regulator
MNDQKEIFPLLKQTLIFNSFTVVGSWWNFKNVKSPFSRLYLITEGEGWIYIHNRILHLTPGKLCLIPKFTFHSYKCDESLGQYYICFLDEMMEGAGMYDLYQFENLVDAQPSDIKLFERLNKLNPNGSIINPDPATYDNKESIHSFSKDSRQKPSRAMETQGIMLQLTSRFISDEIKGEPDFKKSKGSLNKVNYYIDQNIHKKITLTDLANIACLSEDYFSKIFNNIMGIRPMEYLNRKRIERAQMLLITNNLPISQIAEKVGILNYSYFSTLFKKYTLQTPQTYKRLHEQL